MTKIRTFLKSNIGVVFLYVIATLVVLSPILIFKKTTFFTNLDNVDQFYTWYQKLATSWHSGYLPIWNANVQSGSSFAGEIQQGVFYPLNWLWVAVFGGAKGISELALNYLVATHFVIAAFGAYLLLRALNARQWSAFLAGLVFAFGGAVAMRSSAQTVIFFALAYVPYSLYFLVRYHSAKLPKARNLIFGGMAWGLILLVGHIQPFFHAGLALLLFETAYFIKRFSPKKEWRNALFKSLRNLLVLGLFAGVVALPQLWTSAAYLPNVYRVQASGYVEPGTKIYYYEFADAFSLKPHEFVNLIDPVSYPIRDNNDIFIGLAPLAIIVLALVFARNKFKANIVWKDHRLATLLLLSVSILAMLGSFTWFAVVLYKLPFVYQIRQLGRYAVLFNLALVIILTISLESIVRQKISKRTTRILLVIGGLIAVEAVYLFLLRDKIFGLHLALHMGLLSVTIATVALVTSPRNRAILIGFVFLATAVANTAWYLPKVQSDTKTKNDYQISAAFEEFLENTDGEYRVEVMGDALPINAGNVYDFQSIGGYSATTYAPYFRFVHKSGINPELVGDLLGVKYVVSKDKLKDRKVAYYDAQSESYVYERPTALPKFFVSDKEGSLTRNDYRGLATSTETYEDHYQKYKVTNQQAAKVIVSEVFYPGWTAYINGKETPLEDYSVAGNKLFKELYLPAGESTVELRYKAFKYF